MKTKFFSSLDWLFYKLCTKTVAKSKGTPTRFLIQRINRNLACIIVGCINLPEKVRITKSCPKANKEIPTKKKIILEFKVIVHPCFKELCPLTMRYSGVNISNYSRSITWPGYKLSKQILYNLFNPPRPL